MTTRITTESEQHASTTTRSTANATAVGAAPRRPEGMSRLAAELRPLEIMLVTVGTIVVGAIVAIAIALALYSPTRALPVAASDFRLDVPNTLREGTYRITFANRGAQAHELLVFRTKLAAGALPLDKDGNVVEDSPLMHNVLDSGDGLKPSGSQPLSVRLTPGHYVVICNLPQHYRLGMHKNLTVTK